MSDGYVGDLHDMGAIYGRALKDGYWAQVAIADKAGISPKHVNRFVNGVAGVSPEIADALAAAIGMRWEVLLVPRTAS